MQFAQDLLTHAAIATELFAAFYFAATFTLFVYKHESQPTAVSQSGRIIEPDSPATSAEQNLEVAEMGESQPLHAETTGVEMLTEIKAVPSAHSNPDLNAAFKPFTVREVRSLATALKLPKAARSKLSHTPIILRGLTALALA